MNPCRRLADRIRTRRSRRAGPVRGESPRSPELWAMGLAKRVERFSRTMTIRKSATIAVALVAIAAASAASAALDPTGDDAVGRHRKFGERVKGRQVDLYAAVRNGAPGAPDARDPGGADPAARYYRSDEADGLCRILDGVVEAS